MSQYVLEADGLVKRFGREEVLRRVEFRVEPGQVVGLVGANGSGKTTLIKCLLGLLRPSGGSARLFGEESWKLSAAAKSRLGYVCQEFEMLPWMTVQQMCDYTGAFYSTWQAEHVSRLLGEWQLTPGKRTGALSVGQRQKLAVILALGHHPELLILDEPVASLDPAARRQFLQTLIERAEVEHNTILFSTHITSDLERVASHVAILRGGRLAWYGTLDALKEGCKRLRLFAPQPFPANLTIPGAIWYRRCRTMQVESLRPVGRRQLVRQLFTALALDQSIALIPVVGLMIFAVVSPREGGSQAESYGFIALGSAAFLWCYALSTLVFAVRRTWIIVAGALTALALFVGLLIAFAVFAESTEMPGHRQIVGIYVASLIVVAAAAGLTAITYQRSLHREWG